MNAPGLLLVLHAAATIALGGLIWFVQVVHYPLFARVDASVFAHYEALHSRLTSLVVGPLMLVEAVTAFLLVVLLPEGTLAWWGLALLVVVWTSTLALQVPQHRQLEQGFDASAHRRLVRTNWVRTVAWSARGVIALALLPLAA